MKIHLRTTAAPLLLAFAFPAFAANPCDGINRDISQKDKREFAPQIAKQLRGEIPAVVSVKIVQYFSDNDWSVIYVDTHASDEIFLIYHGSPLKNHYLDELAGAYMQSDDEEKSVFDQLTKGKSKGISPKLASCIAWHVTKDRDM